ncbi:MAG: hypothetical protein H6710_05035 [Myxococcales bacterium]|nr:hypothetical protein [Myxococcales bacterium]MCB9705584.1 hypothetical protein [Myxococcales bacterium]
MRSTLRMLPLIALSMSLFACNKSKDGGLAPCESGYVLQEAEKRCVLESVVQYNSCVAGRGISQDTSDQIAGRLGLHFYGPEMGLTSQTRDKAKAFVTLYPDQCNNLMGVWGCYQEATRSADPSTEPLCGQ